MKTKHHLIQLCLGALLLALPLTVQAQFSYSTANGQVTITGYNISYGTAVTIPSTIGVLPVTSIGDGAFEYSHLVSIFIPNTVTNIGNLAFYFCTSLVSVTNANSVTSIGDDAFNNCYALASVIIGTNVTNIGSDAFAYCGLTNLTIPNSVTSIGSEAFYSCVFLTSVAIGNGLTSIGNSAFANCYSLTSVTIPNSVTNIGSDAFNFCSGLTNLMVGATNPNYASAGGVLFDKNRLTLIQFPDGLSGSYAIPNSVTNIGIDAFNDCSGLTSVTVPNSVTSIGSRAFSQCFGMTAITFLGNPPATDGSEFDYHNIFYDQFDTATVYYLSTATGWGPTFDGLSTMAISLPAITTQPASQTVNAGGNVTFTVIASGTATLGYQWYFNSAAIGGANGTSYTLTLNNVNSGNAGNYFVVVTNNFGSVTSSVATLSVQTTAFTFITNAGAITITGYNTNAGVSVAIPPSINGYPVTSIAAQAFNGLTTITNVTIPGTVTIIGVQAFQNCTGLASVTISNGVVTISDAAFLGCTSLAGIAIPNSVTYVGNSTFNGCAALASVSFGTNVATIGGNSFQGCAQLASVVIPDSVTSLGGFAFFQCTGLTNAVVGNGVPGIGAVTFGYAPLKSLTLGTNVTSLGDQAFYACSGLTSVTIPIGVTNVGVGAFSSCTQLRLAYFQGKAPLVDGAAGSTDSTVFNGESGTVFYPTGASGWGVTFGGWPTAGGVYQAQPAIGGGSGVGVSNNKFNFTIAWATNASVVVLASSNLVNWTPLITNALVGGTNAFADSTWTNYPQRFYRVQSH